MDNALRHVVKPNTKKITNVLDAIWDIKQLQKIVKNVQNLIIGLHKTLHASDVIIIWLLHTMGQYTNKSVGWHALNISLLIIKEIVLHNVLKDRTP